MKASSRLALLLCLAGLLAAAAQTMVGPIPTSTPVQTTEIPKADQAVEEGQKPPDEDMYKPLEGRKTCDEEALRIDVHLIASKVRRVAPAWCARLKESISSGRRIAMPEPSTAVPSVFTGPSSL